MVGLCNAKVRRGGYTPFVAPCPPNTKVGISQSETAAGDRIYDQGVAVSGEKKIVNPREDDEVEICGPGVFKFSPMQCAGDRFDYKVETFETKTSDDASCKKVQLEHFAHCYKVEC